MLYSIPVRRYGASGQPSSYDDIRIGGSIYRDMGKADLHIHTVHSDGMGTVSAVLEAASYTDLDIIAVTDHDRVTGALEALDLAPRYGITVIPGMEITTAEGHLLALYVTRAIPRGLSLRESVLRVAEQGGLCVAAHPTAAWIGSIKAPNLLWALTDSDVAHTLVGLEVYNGGLPYLRNNQRAHDLGLRTGLASVANSDSHLLWTIGMWATSFPGSTPADLRWALEHRQTSPVIADRPFRFFTSWMRAKLLRWAGIGYWSSEPGAGVQLKRLSGV
jgi:predicted metal-dependent phosphoesterase TrpH